MTELHIHVDWDNPPERCPKCQERWRDRKRVHYDKQGDKIGETRREPTFFGKDKSVHYNPEGGKTGETREERTFFGRKKRVHYDPEGNKKGETRDE